MSEIAIEFAEYVKKHGRLVDYAYGLWPKEVYSLNGFLITVDPVTHQDPIVSVLDTSTDKLIYVSPHAKRGSLCLFGYDILSHVSSDPDILKRLLAKWRGEPDASK